MTDWTWQLSIAATSTVGLTWEFKGSLTRTWSARPGSLKGLRYAGGVLAAGSKLLQGVRADKSEWLRVRATGSELLGVLVGVECRLLGVRAASSESR